MRRISGRKRCTRIQAELDPQRQHDSYSDEMRKVFGLEVVNFRDSISSIAVWVLTPTPLACFLESR